MKKIEFKDMYTPLSADTFNTMQDNFETAIYELERKFKIMIILDIVLGILLISIIFFIGKH